VVEGKVGEEDFFWVEEGFLPVRDDLKSVWSAVVESLDMLTSSLTSSSVLSALVQRL